jgi:hypothetical protein
MDIPNDAVVAPQMMDTTLLWIGFDQEASERIRAEGFNTFDNLSGMKEKDIRDLVVDSYTRRTIADRRTIFGLKRTRYLIELFIGSRTLPGLAKAPAWPALMTPHPLKSCWTSHLFVLMSGRLKRPMRHSQQGCGPWQVQEQAQVA